MQNESPASLELDTKPGSTSPAAAPVVPRCGSDTGWEVIVGTVVAVAGSTEALVEIPQASTAALKARSVLALSERDVGQSAVLAFEEGDLSKPIILGLIKNPGDGAGKVTVDADGGRFVVTAEKEIELRCGGASITLTRAGKVLIKGEYVLTRSKGVNRIKGAAVSIN